MIELRSALSPVLDAGLAHVTPGDPFALAAWRRAVAEMYAAVRRAAPGRQAAAAFRAARDALFKTHLQSPLQPPAQADFAGLAYFPYDPAWRLIGRLDAAVERETFSVELPADGLFRYTRVGRVSFDWQSRLAQLDVYWTEGYGGGLFLPFLDLTTGRGTYGGGRYLYDTLKGADLGATGGDLVLDFNYAYNPSCAYDHRWVCPLAPPANRLPFAVTAGEKSFANSSEVTA